MNNLKKLAFIIKNQDKLSTLFRTSHSVFCYHCYHLCYH